MVSKAIDLAPAQKKSLDKSCSDFICRYGSTPVGSLLPSAVDIHAELHCPQRRVYDMINVLASLWIIDKGEKNQNRWMAMSRVPDCVEALLAAPRPPMSLVRMHGDDIDREVGSYQADTSAASAKRQHQQQTSLTFYAQRFAQYLLIHGLGSHEDIGPYLTLGVAGEEEEAEAEAAAQDTQPRGSRGKGGMRGRGEEHEAVRTGAGMRERSDKARRLYDAANVLCSIGLVERMGPDRDPSQSWRWRLSIDTLRSCRRMSLREFVETYGLGLGGDGAGAALLPPAQLPPPSRPLLTLPGPQADEAAALGRLPPRQVLLGSPAAAAAAGSSAGAAAVSPHSKRRSGVGAAAAGVASSRAAVRRALGSMGEAAAPGLLQAQQPGYSSDELADEGGAAAREDGKQVPEQLLQLLQLEHAGLLQGSDAGGGKARPRPARKRRLPSHLQLFVDPSTDGTAAAPPADASCAKQDAAAPGVQELLRCGLTPQALVCQLLLRQAHPRQAGGRPVAGASERQAKRQRREAGGTRTAPSAQSSGRLAPDAALADAAVGLLGICADAGAAEGGKGSLQQQQEAVSPGGNAARGIVTPEPLGDKRCLRRTPCASPEPKQLAQLVSPPRQRGGEPAERPEAAGSSGDLEAVSMLLSLQAPPPRATAAPTGGRSQSRSGSASAGGCSSSSSKPPGRTARRQQQQRRLRQARQPASSSISTESEDEGMHTASPRPAKEEAPPPPESSKAANGQVKVEHGRRPSRDENAVQPINSARLWPLAAAEKPEGPSDGAPAEQEQEATRSGKRRRSARIPRRGSWATCLTHLLSQAQDRAGAAGHSADADSVQPHHQPDRLASPHSSPHRSPPSASTHLPPDLLQLLDAAGIPATAATSAPPPRRHCGSSATAAGERPTPPLEEPAASLLHTHPQLLHALAEHLEQALAAGHTASASAAAQLLLHSLHPPPSPLPDRNGTGPAASSGRRPRPRPRPRPRLRPGFATDAAAHEGGANRQLQHLWQELMHSWRLFQQFGLEPAAHHRRSSPQESVLPPRAPALPSSA